MRTKVDSIQKTNSSVKERQAWNLVNLFLYIPMPKWLECPPPPKVHSTWVRSPVQSYQKLMLFDASLLNTKHHKVQVKGKWSNRRKRVVSSSTLSVVIEKWSFGLLSSTVGHSFFFSTVSVKVNDFLLLFMT